MATVWVVGLLWGRGGEESFAAKIDSNLINEAFSLKGSSEEEIETWLEREEVKAVGFEVFQLLAGIATNGSVLDIEYIDGQADEVQKAWQEKGEFVFELEEINFGVAKTKKEAKLAWANKFFFNEDEEDEEE